MNVSNFTVFVTEFQKAGAEMSLLKRRMSDDLKRFYGLDVKGYPIAYLPDK